MDQKLYSIYLNDVKTGYETYQNKHKDKSHLFAYIDKDRKLEEYLKNVNEIYVFFKNTQDDTEFCAIQMGNSVVAIESQNGSPDPFILSSFLLLNCVIGDVSIPDDWPKFEYLKPKDSRLFFNKTFASIFSIDYKNKIFLDETFYKAINSITKFILRRQNLYILKLNFSELRKTGIEIIYINDT